MRFLFLIFIIIPNLLCGEHFTDLKIKQAMQRYGIPCLSVAVVDDLKVQWSEFYSIDPQFDHFNAEAIFQTGQLAQTLTAVGVLLLVQKGKLDLDANVNRYLTLWKIPENQYTKVKMPTIRELLSMTGGTSIPHFHTLPKGSPLPDIHDIIQGLYPSKNGPLEIIAVPGTKYIYSEGGYAIVEKAMEDSVDVTFPILMNQIILLPLGMDHTFFAKTMPTYMDSYILPGFYTEGKEIEGGWTITPSHAAQSLWSSSPDLAHFIAVLCKATQGKEKQFLSPDIVKEMFKKNPPSPYGLGVLVSGEKEDLCFTNIGHEPGYYAFLVGYPYLGKGAVVLCNSESGRELCLHLLSKIAKFYKWPNTSFFQQQGSIKTEKGKE